MCLLCRHLIPGLVPIDAKNISVLWRRYVKKNKELETPDVDFYAFKYMKTTEIVKYLGSRAAALNNSHTTEEMVNKIYDVDREHRKIEALKMLRKVDSSFKKQGNSRQTQLPGAKD